MSAHVLIHPAESDVFAAEREGILEAMRCVVGSQGAAYVATPITGGLRFLEWYETEGRRLHDKSYFHTEYRDKVITPNCESAHRFAETLRVTTSRVVIDPSRFFLEHWTQPAYRTLWCEVVRQFASAVHFNEGWWTSVGCAHEFLAAASKGVPLFDGLREPLGLEPGLSRLESGVDKLREVGAPFTDLAAIVGDIKVLLQRGSL
jgi:hypothetical protein